MPESLAKTIRTANQALLVDGDHGQVGDWFAPDYVAHLTEQDMAGGPAAVRRFLGLLQSAFTDLQVEVEILLEGKDRVAWQRTLRAKHTGDFQGFPATGRRVVWRDQFTSRFEGRRFAEDWVVSDLAERLLLAKKR